MVKQKIANTGVEANDWKLVRVQPDGTNKSKIILSSATNTTVSAGTNIYTFINLTYISK